MMPQLPRTIRTLLLPLALLTGSLGVAAAADEDSGPKPLALGQAAPMADTQMKSVDGRTITLASATGKKGTLVIFICNHCPWVKAWQSRIAAIGNAAVKHGIGVVAVNSNDPAAYADDDFEPMVARAKEVGYRFPYAVDATSEVARAFGATRTPEAFLFDARGKLVYHGAVDDNAHEPKAVKQTWLRDAVEAVAKGKDVREAETKALGCGIKYRAKSSES